MKCEIKLISSINLPVQTLSLELNILYHRPTSVIYIVNIPLYLACIIKINKINKINN